MKLAILVEYVLLALFMFLSFFMGNTEFLIYAIVLLPLVVFLHISDTHFSYHTFALWGFALWMLLHLLGGLASFAGTRFYDLILIPIIGSPYDVLKYDQVVHFFCYIVIAGLLGSILAKLSSRTASRTVFYWILVLAASGVGALNEIIEFLPVALFNSPGPGGYINTAIDIIMNFLGSLVGGALYIWKVKIK